MSERKPGRTKLVYDKTKRKIVRVAVTQPDQDGKCACCGVEESGYARFFVRPGGDPDLILAVKLERREADGALPVCNKCLGLLVEAFLKLTREAE